MFIRCAILIGKGAAKTLTGAIEGDFVKAGQGVFQMGCGSAGLAIGTTVDEESGESVLEKGEEIDDNNE
jgi:hypothetical protein